MYAPGYPPNYNMTQPPYGYQPIPKPGPMQEMPTPANPNLSQSQNNAPNYYAGAAPSC